MTAAIDIDTSTEDTTSTEVDATTEDATDTGDQPDDADTTEVDDADDQEDDEPEDDAETFTRSYVEKLRRENQRYRDQAKTADTLAKRLHVALVAATGKLADPTDLEFDAAHLDDADAMATAIDELLTAKPHLRNRRPVGDIGQGASRSDETVDLAGILRARA